MYDQFEPGDSLRISRNIYSSEGDIAPYIQTPLEKLKELREQSAAKEEGLFDKVCEAADAWQKQALETLSIQDAMEYLQTKPLEHTYNQWHIDEYGRYEISNMVYRMTYRIEPVTEYNRALRKSETIAWTVTWQAYIRHMPPYYGSTLGEQKGKRFAARPEAQKYIEGRKAAYAHLFEEISPPIPLKYEDNFKVHGVLLPGYTVEGWEEEKPEPESPPTPTRPHKKHGHER